HLCARAAGGQRPLLHGPPRQRPPGQRHGRHLPRRHPGGRPPGGTAPDPDQRRAGMNLELALHVLDRQLVSADGELCGKVDDIELAQENGSLRTAAVLSGLAAWPARLPPLLRAPASALLGGEVARIEWDEIAEVSAVVRLKLPAAEVGRRRAALAGRARL